MTDWLDAGAAGSEVAVLDLLTGANVDLVARIVQAGVLLSIGRTSDGGAVGVTVTADGRWRREYFREPDELEHWLTGAADFAESIADDLAASSARRKRSRGRRDP